jgi:adenylate cyclase
MLFLTGIWQGGYLEAPELKAYDSLLRFRSRLPANDRIALVTIGEDDIQQLGRWPIDDATLSTVLETLETEQQALAIGLDMYRDIAIPPGHEALSATLLRHPNIIATYKWSGSQLHGVGAPPPLRNSGRIGFNDIIVDPDGVTRRALLYLQQGDDMVPSFGLTLSLRFLERHGILPVADAGNPAFLKLGHSTFPPLAPNAGGYSGADTAGYQFMLDYRDAPDTFISYSLSDLLAGRIPPQTLKGRIVLIGTDAQSVKDYFHTPLETIGKTPGVRMHAFIISQLLRLAIDGGRPNPSLPEYAEALWLSIWIAAGCLVGFRAISLWRLPLLWLMGIAATIGFAVLAIRAGYWLPVILPTGGWSVAFAAMSTYAAVWEKRQKTETMRLFEQFVSPQVAQAIWAGRDGILQNMPPEPVAATATVLFSDMIGFTSIVEKLDPAVAIAWLEDYLNSMANCVHAHDGVIVRFVGDAIMAVFGVPLSASQCSKPGETAAQAAACALAMNRNLQELNRKWRSQNLPVTGMRIGINTGKLIAGSLGTATRREFAVHGDAVNIAARLEQLDKKTFVPDCFQRPSRILMGETTEAELGPDFSRLALGTFKLRGKGRALAVFELLAK